MSSSERPAVPGPDLAILEPGVHTVGNQPNISSTDRTKRGMGLELSIAGGRPQQNNYLMDGVNINNYTNAGPGSLLGGNLGTDAVGRVFRAHHKLFCGVRTYIGRGHQRDHQIGHPTSSARNGGMSSYGTNRWMRQTILMILTAARKRLLFRGTSHGGSIGGPIQKDKTFFFVDYEGVKQNLGSTLVATVPTPADVAAAGRQRSLTLSRRPRTRMPFCI